MKAFSQLWTILVSVTLLLALWAGIVRFSDISPALLPSPFVVLKAIAELCRDGTLRQNITDSLWRFAVGYVLAISTGTLLGILVGWYRVLFDYLNPILQFLRPIAPVAWMPFIVLFWGIGDLPAIVIIFIAAFFPVLLTTARAVINLDPVYLKIVANYGVKSPSVLWKIVFPAVFPQIANSFHIALGSAWIFLVSGEMVGTQSGLGYMIVDARNNMRSDHLLAAMVLVGAIGLILDLLIARAELAILKFWGQTDVH